MRFALTACLLLSSAAFAAKPGFPVAWKTSTLKNGLTVVRAPFKSPGLVAYFTVVRVGSRNEIEPGMTGFAHFFEHVMFKGTPTYPGSAREALLGKLGFAENAWTSDDITVYHVTGPTTGLEKLVELEADRFRNLSYGEETFQTEARAVLGEYHKNAANPALKLNETLRATAFKTHTYRHTTLGFYEDIQAMPTRYAYSKQFFARWYAPDNVTVVVAGDFDDAALMRWVEQRYGGWATKAAKLAVPKEPPQTELRTALVDWKTPTLPRHGHYWHTPATLKDAATQLVLADYLAGPTSPLYKALVLEQQVVDTLGASYPQRREAYLFGLVATLKDEAKRPAVDRAFADAVAALGTGTVDAARVQAVKDHVLYSMLLDLETPEAVASTLAVHAGLYGSPAAVERLQAALRALRPQDLVNFTKKHLVDSNRTSLVLTVPEKGAAQ